MLCSVRKSVLICIKAWEHRLVRVVLLYEPQ